jgi:Tol biopolymer transport system component
MGEVYLAHDLMLDRRIGVKILPRRFTEDNDQVQRFEREARAASALNHPNILTIYEIGRVEDLHFIATEFVDGKTLRERIADRHLSLAEALSIALQIAEALTAAHGAGIVHRDIKPENVMIRPDGLVKVLDFGLARPVEQQMVGDHRLSASVSLTDPDVLMGTITYLSPEQARREKIDQRTDIFSLGIVLYEMLIGRRPFAGSTPAVILEAILTDDPVVARTDLPENLKSVIGQALQKDRDARYQSAAEMRDDLQQVIRSVNERRQRSTPRWRIRTALGVVAVVILAALLAIALRRETGSAEAPSFLTGPVKRITDMPGEEIFPSLSPDGQQVVYASRSSGNWDIYLKKLDEPRAVNLTAGDQHLDLEPALSPDGTRIAFRSSREGMGIFLMNSDGKNRERVSTDGHNPAWSPDGQEIVFAEDRVFDYEGRNFHPSRLFAVRVQTGERRLIGDSDAVQPNWSSKGHRIAYWGIHKGGQKDIWTVSSSGGQPVAVTDDEAVDWNPVWSRDGKYLYFLSNRGGSMNLWRAPIDESSGTVTGALEPITLPSAHSQHLSFSADGRSLVYVEMNRRENTWGIAFDPVAGRVIGQPTEITHGSRRYASAEVSPDEKSLVFSSVGDAQEDVFIINRDDGGIKQLTNDSALDRSPRWSPDGQQVAIQSDRSGKYEIWKVNADGTGLAQLTDVPSGDVFSPVWSPDGQRLLYKVRSVGSFVVQLGKSAAATQPLSSQHLPSFLPWSWSPDGKLVAGWRLDPGPPDYYVMVYSFPEQRYIELPERGQNPIWLNDSKRLIYTRLGSLHLYDNNTGASRILHSAGGTSNVGTLSLSRDNRRLYYSLRSSEAAIHLLSLN